ncbi:kinesin family protein-like protein [Patellaria atrata CBS 101060]|uniref:Kinesin family protein-like protein n=1 Tax=Patellaria atrata CBS 101060 TaxID=1346257 RepID=A0A9P4VUZ2_9PEZI|nr:kinesin family protein-like protein [Patellaria atrata CBS 101060]
MSMSSKVGGGSRASDEDGKTAVKVAVRVRPPLKPSDPGYELVPQRFRGSTCHVTTPTSLAIESAQGKKLFVFDRVFGEDIDQEGVYEYLNESIDSFVQGYNVSILAYGQSGAGKSYTMGTTGPREQSDPRIMGIIPRAAATLFEKLTGSPSSRNSGLRTPSRYSSHGLPTLPAVSKSSGDKSWQLKATYVEIYNEQLRDLLLDESVSMNERQPVTIREDTKGRILLTGLRQININSIEDLLNALNFGSSIRQTDATAVNAKSSRSHAVFSLNLVQKRSRSTPRTAQEKRFSVPIEAMSGGESWVTVDSKLHFVDLAGSERLKNTGAQGERAREGISINAGLASLGKVISQLSSRAAGAHVSYRDSKLTRLLQDSLGGNAITYMVACVNPAEFHLSETLNTVQYAQRARAIQSKPQIQQVSDDSDKQAIIDRLRAEVSFLRDQIRLSERAERKSNAPQERSERLHEREVELQNQLLDIQENYNALNQRHTKLITEISKARDTGAEDTPMLSDAIGDSAVERLKRSNSFAETVNQVILEYEKTIQSLETSLSNTRSSLSNSESILLEKETKIAYMETVTQQLQARISKAMDREANSENYLRDLEAKVDGIASGEEKSSSVIQDLRKELTRARENEASCEEYITTLEERLAEAEQDHEMMQREIDRLEHVIERQRSIGKLDNLLYELDAIRQTESRADTDHLTNGHSKKGSGSFHSRKTSMGTMSPTNDTRSPNGTGIDGRLSMVESEAASETIVAGSEAENRPGNIDSSNTRVETPLADELDEVPQSPAQSKFVADKLETVTSELLYLREEHETTLTEYEELQEKYRIALGTLAELQDAVDEARHATPISTRPTSFLANAGVNGLKEDGQPSSSRTLSSELSLVGESGESLTTPGITDIEAAQKRSGSPDSENFSQEVETLKKLNAEKEENMAELSENYAKLQEKHRDTLDFVEELKTEVQRAQMARPQSPTAQVIRRKSSQNVMTTDRANRAFASLRNIALDQFEEQPDLIQSFEINLNALMTELHTRSERVQALEAETASIRSEMETKMKIISGLTRERSSLKSASPMDISVVASMRDQLAESEYQNRMLQEAHAAREKELNEEVEQLKSTLDAHLQSAAPGEVGGSAGTENMPGVFPETPAPEVEASKELGRDMELDETTQPHITQLQSEISEWKTKHLSTLESSRASEQKLLATISELEASIERAELAHAEQLAKHELHIQDLLSAASDADNERVKQEETVRALQNEINEHKAAAATHSSQLKELEQSQVNILRQIEDDSTAKELTDRELQTHRELVSNLESQIEEHKTAIAMHQEGIVSLQKSHAKEIETINTALLEAKAEADERLAAQIAEHDAVTKELQDQLTKAHAAHKSTATSLQSDLNKARNVFTELVRGIASALNQKPDASLVQSHVEALVEERKNLLAQHGLASEELQNVQRELEATRSDVLELEGKVTELSLINEETLRELETISEKEKKSARLVEELEDQLSSNYDQHQAATNRLSALQTERQSALDEVLQTRMEVEKELEEARARIANLEATLGETKRNSARESLDPRDIGLSRTHTDNANLRKSTSHNSLPSPPPAIPLPPLPGSPPPGNGPSPPTSRHQSKDIAQAQLVEDQEARIRTIEKHLFAEKQLTATLEEALTDLEASSTKVKAETDAWKKKCQSLEEELKLLKNERNQQRYSLQAVEEERNARMRVEAERAHLEARMAALNNANKKNKKKSTLNCF